MDVFDLELNAIGCVLGKKLSRAAASEGKGTQEIEIVCSHKRKMKLYGGNTH